MMLIQSQINKMCAKLDLGLNALTSSMHSKFDKYWEKLGKINQLLLYAVAKDPRYKTTLSTFA